MQVTAKTRRRLRLEGAVFVVLLLAAAGMLAWLSVRYSVDADWTAGARNSLAPASRALLDRLHGPVSITAYAGDDPSVRRAVAGLVARYQRYRHDVALKWIDPATHPDQVRRADIKTNGELLVSYGGRSEHVTFPPSEEQVTNALQRAARSGDKWLVFLDGHGERSPTGGANFDLGDWGSQLKAKGFKLKALKLGEAGSIPDNTAAVVIASPQVPYLPGEVATLQRYLAGGGNLLWLAEPGGLQGLKPLADQLGVTLQPGTAVDAAAQAVGIEDPSIVVVANYGDHPITRDFNLMTVFPQARPIKLTPEGPWKAAALLRTTDRSWSETGRIAGTIRYDAGSDVKGPLILGAALSHQRPAGPGGGAAAQRAVVLGDGDFLSNTYLGNAGNLEFGMNVVNWLTSDDRFINVPVRAAPDVNLTIPRVQAGVLGGFFLVGVPVALAGGGTWVWWRRRRR